MLNCIFIIILSLFIWSKYKIKSVNTESNKVEDNLVWVYDTNQYQAYKQFTSLIGNFPPETLEYIGDISRDNADYHQYGNEDITVEVMTVHSYLEQNNQGPVKPVDYVVSYQGKTFTFQELPPAYATSVTIYYVDINKDDSKDLVIEGSPYSGTNSAYYWLRAVNLVDMEEIEVFEIADSIRLTTDQLDTLDKMLEKDMEFQRLFPDYEWLGNYAHFKVDCFGNIYYEIGLGKEINHGIGFILLLFDYNKTTLKYDLVDYVYMPDYVSVD